MLANMAAMNDTDLAWLGGFFDAAGTIYVTSSVKTYRDRPKRYFQVSVAVSRPAEDAAVLEALAAAYGGRIYDDPACVGSLRWMAQAQADVHGFLCALAPYLRIKGDRAYDAIARIESTGRRGASLAAGVGRATGR